MVERYYSSLDELPKRKTSRRRKTSKKTSRRKTSKKTSRRKTSRRKTSRRKASRRKASRRKASRKYKMSSKEKARMLRPSPAGSATLYPQGFTQIGKDGKMWAIAVNKNGTHRWVRQ